MSSSTRKSTKRAVTFIDEVDTQNHSRSTQEEIEGQGEGKLSNGRPLKKSNTGAGPTDIGHESNSRTSVRREFLDLFRQRCYSEGV